MNEESIIKEIQKMESQYDRKIEKQIVHYNIAIEKILETIKPYKKQPKPILRRKKIDRLEEQDVLMISDCHIGNNFSLEETNGVSEYNPEIFKNRLLKLQNKVFETHKIHGAYQKYNILNILLLGDIVHGDPDIGSWKESTVPLNVMSQCLEGIDCISDFIYNLSSIYDNINIYGVRGNHGRTVLNNNLNDDNNWDSFCYKILKKRNENIKNVNFNLTKSWFIKTNILDKTIFVTHGDEISDTSMNKLECYCKEICSLHGHEIDIFCIGHFHIGSYFQTNNSEILINGSFVGGNEFSIRKLRKNNFPSQKMFGVKKEENISWQYNFKL